MDIKSNYNVSFKAVSINPTDTKKASKVAQVINLGFDKLGKLRAENNYDTFESLNKAHDEVTAQMSAKRRRINSRPWFVPKGGSLSRLDTKEMKLKENLDKQRIILLEREQRRIAEMKKVVNDVSTQACSYEEQTINDVKRFKNRDKMERFRARHSIVTGGFNSIAGYDSEKSILKKYFISEIIKEQEGKKANVPGSVLFFGPTGNGKTTFAKAFAKETGCELVPLRLGLNVDDKYSVFMETLHKKANEAEERFKQKKVRTILFIDEIGKVANKKSPIAKELNKFLSDCSKKHCTVFAATNSPLEINLPLTGKNSVFPYKISLDPPSKENKAQILEYYLYERLPKDTNFDKMAEHMEELEEKTGRRFNISQIKQTIGVNGFVHEISPEEVYAEMDKMIPAIDTSSMQKYNKEMNVLMENRIKE